MLRVSTFTDLSQTGMDGLQSTSSFSTTLATRSSTVTSARTTRRVSSSQSASYRGGVATVGRASFTAGRLRSRKVNNVLMAVVAADSTWLEQCLKSNMNTNQLGPEGMAPLHVAAKRGLVPCLTLLLDHPGTDIQLCTSPAGHNALHLAATAKKASMECVAMLIKAGVDINQQNNAKNTPLHQAAMVGRAECVVALLEAGADPMIENSNGHSSYQVARLWGQRECARYLQAVQWAATKNKEEIARHHHQKTAEATRRISEHRQRSLQAARSQDAYDDWMAAKGLERSSSASSLAEKHTVSSMLRSRSSMPNIGDASDARSMASSRMSSKCSSLWSVRTAPSSISWTKLDLGDWAKSNMSLASSADSDHFPPPRDGPAKPIVISFRHKRQHQEPLVVPQRPASAHRKRRASTPGLVASRPKSCKKKSTRRDNDLNSGSDESLFRSSSSSDILVVDEHYGLPALRSSARDGGMQSPGPSSIQAWLTGSSYSVGSDSPKEEDGEPSARPSDVAVYLTPPTPSPPQSPTPPPPSSQMAMRPLRANSLRLAFLRTASLTAVQEEPNNSSGDESVGSVEGSLHNYPMQRYLSDNSLALVPSNDLVNFSNDFEFC